MSREDIEKRALAMQKRADKERLARNFSASCQHYDEARLMWRAVDNGFGVAYCTYGNGLRAQEEGKYAEADALFNRSLGFFENVPSGDERYEEAMKHVGVLQQQLNFGAFVTSAIGETKTKSFQEWARR